MNTGKLLLAGSRFLLASLPLVAATAAAEVSLQVSANRPDIYIGESFLLSVRVQGSDSAQEPDLSRLRDGARVRLLGSQNQSNYSITMINGRITRSGFSGREFTYEVTPVAAGVFRAGPVMLTADGRTISDPGPTVNVQGVARQDTVAVQVAATRNSILVDEPFSVTVSVAIRRLPGPNADFDPIDPRDPPNISIPFLSEPPGEGLSGPDIRQVLQEKLASRAERAVFTINDFTTRNDPFSGMFGIGMLNNAQPARFALSRRQLERNGSRFFEYYLTLEYTPRQETDCTFGPVLFKGSVVTGVDAGGNAVMTRIFAVGPACTVRVVPPPEEGRPPTYIGAIGSNITVEAALDAQTCKVGDPLTLTIAVSGGVRMPNPRPPVLTEQQDIARLFRVYDDTVKTVTDGEKKKFIYTLRPTEVGTLELPPVQLSYYDVNTGSYRTVLTAPIAVRANPAAEFSDTSLLNAGTNSVRLKLRQGDARMPPAPIDLSRDGTRRIGIFDPAVHVPIMLAGPAFFLLAAAVFAVRRAAPGISAAARNIAALRAAMADLKQAGSLANSDPAEARRLEARAARRCLEARIGERSRSWTANEAERNLKAMGVPDSVAAGVSRVLRDASGATFGGAVSEPSRDFSATKRLLREFHASLGEAGKARRQ